MRIAICDDERFFREELRKQLDNYAKENGFSITKEKFNGNFWEITKNGEKIIFLKPLSYMNLSGTVVRKYVDYFKIQPSDILVIHDDLDISVGNIKFKINSSSGGHNGIKSIINRLNTQEFARLKVGVSHDKSVDTKDYVLGNFSKVEKDKFTEMGFEVNMLKMKTVLFSH